MLLLAFITRSMTPYVHANDRGQLLGLEYVAVRVREALSSLVNP